ncbi:MAG: glycosyl transferase, partial [Microbacterium sp.]|nr:glycosyl transferase [Microbacterium sp.]
MTHVPSASVQFDPATATIAVVTYNRSGLLTRLLTSITEMDPKPGHIVVIDNASTDDTTDVVESFRESLEPATLVYRRMETNTGGSGGFSEG